MKKYNFSRIEKKWQAKWLKDKTYEPNIEKPRKKGKFYNLMMFPYPSAEGLHVGNMYAFTGSDIYGRFKRMEGYDVLEPIGLDGFGIHSENYALKVGTHPVKQSKVSEKRFYQQLRMIGNGFAWQEHVETYDPEYYRWTQWLFVQMWRHGLAYRKKQSVNWCPKDKTVLADEQVIAGKCERCGAVVEKRELEQWFFKITEYAGRLLKNLDAIDWAEKVKIAQRNWIGKSEGALLRFRLTSDVPSVGVNIKDVGRPYLEVFTTRPDTLFGATYVVLSPEHELVEKLKDRISNFKEVAAYAKKAAGKSDEERIAGGKDLSSHKASAERGKTGVELKGIKAINPANDEEIPVWVADYVLGSYGTGAIMAVPAHDERDFEFAKKFGLPIRQVIALETGIPRPSEERRDGGCGVVFDPRTQKYAVAVHPDGIVRLFGGGFNDGEDGREGTLHEIAEESGLYDFSHVEEIGTCFAHYRNRRKQVYRSGLTKCFLVILRSDKVKERHPEPHEVNLHLEWMPAAEIVKNWKGYNQERDLDHWLAFLREGVARAIELGYDTTSNPAHFPSEALLGVGKVVNSGKFDGVDSEEAKWEITKFVHGEKKTQFHLRDWLISRQRYWGPPIPMIRCEVCAAAGKGENKEMPGWYAVPEKDLPVKLPMVKDFRPEGKGESPLASVKTFYEVKCPACGSKAQRETDVSDTFLDSSWYYIGYLMKCNNGKLKIGDSAFAERMRVWLPVDMYIGGAEHSVLHLLYSRFVSMALHDWGLVDFEEPFTTFRAHGLVIKEGAKMSKSKGNVVNPDEYIKKFGADALRMYLMFMAPLEQGGDFRDSGILGITRFLDRVWKITQRVLDPKKSVHSAPAFADTHHVPDGFKRILHKTIKKVTEDIESLQYNTAISALMILLNEAEKQEKATGLPRYFFEDFLKLLAPFAPHIMEELWRELGNKSSIHLESLPAYEEKMLKENAVEVIVQVNGKRRGSVMVEAGTSEETVQDRALSVETVAAALRGQKVKRVIYIKGKIINLVI